MPKTAVSPEQKLRNRYKALVTMKSVEKDVKQDKLARHLDVCLRTLQLKLANPGTQTLAEVQHICGPLGIGILFYDKENEDVTVTRRLD